MAIVKTETENFISPSLDTSNRFPDDTLLREFKFRLMSRPANGPAIWTRDGREYTEKQALKIVARHRGRTLNGGL